MPDPLARIQHLALTPVGDGLRSAMEQSADPEVAWPRLERWIAAAANPASLFQALQANEVLMESFTALLGASGYCADILAQNPEMASVLLDPDQATQTPNVDLIIADGRRLLQSAHSTDHRLDRLRLIKQEWSLRIAFCEIHNLWPEPDAWKALADVADALVRLAVESLWPPFSAERGGPEVCPLSVAAFGKLGGQELNYSSDIDLLYMIPDDASDEVEQLATRFATHLGKALENQMGRGILYRVDLRLRPFGSRGPIVSRWSSVEAYYERYAEAWERLALIRSRVLIGDSERWETLRERTCFGRHVTDFEILELASQREQMEGLSKGDDLKRGPGGIRDVEFYAQIHQLLFGRDEPALRGRLVLDTLGSLASLDIVPRDLALSLQEGYCFLRKLEHLIQIEESAQTHSIPVSERGLTRLAKCAALTKSEVLMAKLTATRSTVRECYRSLIQGVKGESFQDQVLSAAGQDGEALRAWMNKIEGEEFYWEALAMSDSGVDRCVRLISEGERLASELASLHPLVDLVVSGEIQEPLGMPSELLGGAIHKAWIREQARWVLAPDERLGASLAEIVDWTIRKVSTDLPLVVIGLGSYGIREMSPGSDADLVLLGTADSSASEVESAGREFLQRFQRLQLDGCPIKVDLRLRPEGNQGAVARTPASFVAYAERYMEPWERLAVAKSRLICGDEAIFELVAERAYSTRLTSEDLEGLIALKKRVEMERVDQHHRNRDFKLGPGGIDDLAWLCGLAAMFNPAAQPKSLESNTHSRIEQLFAANELNVLERDALLQAAAHFMVLRWRLDVMGYAVNLVPENPDRLEKVAMAMGHVDANELLAAHAEHRSAVRGMFLGQIERMRTAFSRTE